MIRNLSFPEFFMTCSFHDSLHESFIHGHLSSTKTLNNGFSWMKISLLESLGLYVQDKIVWWSVYPTRLNIRGPFVLENIIISRVCTHKNNRGFDRTRYTFICIFSWLKQMFLNDSIKKCNIIMWRVIFYTRNKPLYFTWINFHMNCFCWLKNVRIGKYLMTLEFVIYFLSNVIFYLEILLNPTGITINLSLDSFQKKIT